MAKKKLTDRFRKIWRKAARSVKHPSTIGEKKPEEGKGVLLRLVRSKDDKRTAIDESQEGPIQGLYIGLQNDAEEPTEEEVAAADYTWWKDLRFLIPTGVGLFSIIVSVILWWFDRLL